MRRVQVRSPFHTGHIFPPIEPGVVGWTAAAGPLWTGASDGLGWAKLVLTGGDSPRVVALDASQPQDLIATNRQRGLVCRVPAPDVHPDVALQLARPREQREWCLHHTELMLLADEEVIIDIVDIVGTAVMFVPDLAKWLVGIGRPCAMTELARVTGGMHHWGSLALPAVLASVRAFFQSETPLDETVVAQRFERALLRGCACQSATPPAPCARATCCGGADERHPLACQPTPILPPRIAQV